MRFMHHHTMSRLSEAAKKNGPLCVELDTNPASIPARLLQNYPSPADAVLAYNRAIIERLDGMNAYAQTLRAVKDAGLTVIADIKRSDIADTASVYARAHFSGDFEADIITLNPYMGFDTLSPFLEYARPRNGKKGMFVLLKTSNAGAVVGCTEVQSARHIRDTYAGIFFLIPGYGAQGGTTRAAAILLEKAGGVA